MKKAAKILNLKPHQIKNVTLYGPVDMEVHKGVDDRLYLLGIIIF